MRLLGVQHGVTTEPGTTPATTHSGATGVRTRGCAATARRVARDPVARKAAQIKVRSKFYAKKRRSGEVFKSWHSQKSLQRWGGCEPIHPLCKETLLTEAGALDKAGYRSAPAYIAELRLRHIEPDFAISQALDRTFKKVNDAITRGLGPAKKAPEVKLSAIQYTVDSSVVGGCGRRLRGLSALVTSSR